MAGITIILHRKGGPTVMAGTTGFPLLHPFHRHWRVLAVRRHKDVRVAFRAVVHSGVDLMAEEDGAAIVFKGHIAGRVTLSAISFHREGA